MPNPVTFVNIIDVEPEQQQAVIDILKEGSEKVISHRPGFISVTIIASADQRRVINIARWHSADDVRATQADPAAAEYAQRTAAIAQAHPGLYATVAEYTARA
ncbi:hypothetical protein GCM10023065_01350 [Microbacterium laevaniformans]|uniref:antibiotic biosynthesis monooxygenase n=1 Tax=Microbacterium laevaniformans TaxID=36807 RepID=UPI00195835A6|nr:antibiotic biosynthesis monooxygenase [Microbacterium laevaniformans]MBM7754022.1 heme-degrading monooxygenase HmoA [Microbacterium laevaniformans]GLJ65760.1 hypothetical protein GCM10017578_26490 [Microbacterium laevaniformans]